MKQLCLEYVLTAYWDLKLSVASCFQKKSETKIFHLSLKSKIFKLYYENEPVVEETQKSIFNSLGINEYYSDAKDNEMP